MEIITITNRITLQPITLDDCDKLHDLMKDIYPKVYKYLWKDNGSWYINMLYNPTNIQQELNEANTVFYFVNFDGEAIGILRILYHCVYPKFPNLKATKLHRIYLNPKVIRQGIGKALINWTKVQTEIVGDEILWLEAMNTQPNAVSFYEKMGFQIGSHVILPYERLLSDKRGMHQMWLTI
ncbi:MAG: GNAT family N-acetyltransferase [Saprospiraceae bacterium]